VSTQGQLAETEANLHKTREERDEKSFLVEEHIRNEQTLFTEAEEVNISPCSMDSGWINKLSLEETNTKIWIHGLLTSPTHMCTDTILCTCTHTAIGS